MGFKKAFSAYKVMYLFPCVSFKYVFGLMLYSEVCKVWKGTGV